MWSRRYESNNKTYTYIIIANLRTINVRILNILSSHFLLQPVTPFCHIKLLVFSSHTKSAFPPNSRKTSIYFTHTCNPNFTYGPTPFSISFNDTSHFSIVLHL